MLHAAITDAHFVVFTVDITCAIDYPVDRRKFVEESALLHVSLNVDQDALQIRITQLALPIVEADFA